MKLYSLIIAGLIACTFYAEAYAAPHNRHSFNCSVELALADESKRLYTPYNGTRTCEALVIFKDRKKRKNSSRVQICRTTAHTNSCSEKLRFPGELSPEYDRPIKVRLKGEPLFDAEKEAGCLIEERAATVKVIKQGNKNKKASRYKAELNFAIICPEQKDVTPLPTIETPTKLPTKAPQESATVTATTPAEPSPSPTLLSTPSITPSLTPLPEPTSTPTQFSTPITTITASPTQTQSSTPTDSPNPEPSSTTTSVSSITPTHSPIATATFTRTQIPTILPTLTSTTTPTPFSTQTVAAAPTESPTYTPSLAPSSTSISTSTSTSAATLSHTPTTAATATTTNTAAPSFTQTAYVEPTDPPIATYTSTSLATSTAIPPHTPTTIPTQTTTSTPLPSSTQTATVVIATSTSTSIFTATLTLTFSPTPTKTPTTSPTVTSTRTQTSKPTLSATHSATPTSTPTTTLTFTRTATRTPTGTSTPLPTVTATRTASPIQTTTTNFPLNQMIGSPTNGDRWMVSALPNGNSLHLVWSESPIFDAGQYVINLRTLTRASTGVLTPSSVLTLVNKWVHQFGPSLTRSFDGTRSYLSYYHPNSSPRPTGDRDVRIIEYQGILSSAIVEHQITQDAGVQPINHSSPSLLSLSDRFIVAYSEGEYRSDVTANNGYYDKNINAKIYSTNWAQSQTVALTGSEIGLEMLPRLTHRTDTNQILLTYTSKESGGINQIFAKTFTRELAYVSKHQLTNSTSEPLGGYESSQVFRGGELVLAYVSNTGSDIKISYRNPTSMNETRRVSLRSLLAGTVIPSHTLSAPYLFMWDDQLWITFVATISVSPTFRKDVFVKRLE